MTEVNIEENLTWLQKFYATKVNRLKLELSQFILDEQLEDEPFYCPKIWLKPPASAGKDFSPCSKIFNLLMLSYILFSE